MAVNPYCTQQEAGKVHIVEVADTGPGMTAEDRERIFYSLLYVAKRRAPDWVWRLCNLVVSDHGGRVWVEGEPGQGTKFVIELPDAVRNV